MPRGSLLRQPAGAVAASGAGGGVSTGALGSRLAPASASTIRCGGGARGARVFSASMTPPSRCECSPPSWRRAWRCRLGGAHSATALPSPSPALSSARARLGPQAGVLGTRGGEIGAQPRQLLLADVTARARHPRRVGAQEIAVVLLHRDHLAGERILPEHRPHALLDRLAIVPDVGLGVGERLVDGGALARLAAPLPHRRVHQIGVGLLLGRDLRGGSCQLLEQRPALRLLGHRLAGLCPRRDRRYEYRPAPPR